MMGLNGVFAIIAALGGAIYVAVVVGTVLFGKKITSGHKLTFPLHAGGGAAASHYGSARHHKAAGHDHPGHDLLLPASSSTTSSTGNICRSCGCSADFGSPNGDGEVTMLAAVRMTVSLLKLRIGSAVAASALAGHRGRRGAGTELVASAAGLTLAVLGASGAAGAFNHYHERDLDRLMRRTRVASLRERRIPRKPMVARRLRRLACRLAGAGGSVRRHAFGSVRVPRRIHLRHRLYGLAEAAQRVEHRHRRARRQLRRACRCRSRGSRRRKSFPRAGGGAFPLDAAAFLESCGCERRGLRQGRGADAADRRAGACLDARDPDPHRGPWSRSRSFRSGSARDWFYGLGAGIGGGSSFGRVSFCIRRRPSRTRWQISLPRCCNSGC